MNITLTKTKPCGEIAAISSKSAAHRLLICAALADKPTKIFCGRSNKDIDATARCLCALGTQIEYTDGCFHVIPISTPISGATLMCGESGSTLRFLLPLVCALGVRGEFFMEGRLPSRPLSPLYEELVAHGADLGAQGKNPLFFGGTLSDNTYKIRGDVSSQFISGLLFALCARGGGTIEIVGELQSAPYVDMTIDALRTFGVQVEQGVGSYTVPMLQRLVSPKTLTVEGDWSNAAFPLCMGVLGKDKVTVSGLSQSSSQGDRAVCDILRSFGASITADGDKITAHGGKALHATDIDASQIPDLVPVLATVASVAVGTTHIRGAARLRLKESDRIQSVCNMLSSLGANIRADEDGMTVVGVPRLSGGTVDCQNDHRIAMSAAVAAAVCDGSVQIVGAECVSKSYPDFWSDIKIHLGVSE